MPCVVPNPFSTAQHVGGGLREGDAVRDPGRAGARHAPAGRRRARRTGRGQGTRGAAPVEHRVHAGRRDRQAAGPLLPPGALETANTLKVALMGVRQIRRRARLTFSFPARALTGGEGSVSTAPGVWASSFAALGINYQDSTMNLDLCDRKGKSPSGCSRTRPSHPTRKATCASLLSPSLSLSARRRRSHRYWWPSHNPIPAPHTQP